MKKLPERPKLPKFTQEEINSPNNAIPIKKIKFVAKHFLIKGKLLAHVNLLVIFTEHSGKE